MSGLSIPPVTPVTAFDDLLDALGLVRVWIDQAGKVDDPAAQDQALDNSAAQLERALDAHTWLLAHGDALDDLRDVLTFVYGEVT
ncbi:MULTISPECIES: hypothetical protein [unclassified Yoonia]|uniref:hypothetical protein n=1 Tax=unclassified Yoonia TaxID=2629118 RepID=UPI002AFE5616|nr:MULTISPECIES: hypothetical protein [unclassified Yoonia]